MHLIFPVLPDVPYAFLGIGDERIRVGGLERVKPRHPYLVMDVLTLFDARYKSIHSVRLLFCRQEFKIRKRIVGLVIALIAHIAMQGVEIVPSCARHSLEVEAGKGDVMAVV